MQRPKRKLGPAQSPVVSATLAKKRKDVKARHAFKWALWSILTALVIALDRWFKLCVVHVVWGGKAQLCNAETCTMFIHHLED